MPARKATASGKWSQSIWDVTPGVGDDVFQLTNAQRLEEKVIKDAIAKKAEVTATGYLGADSPTRLKGLIDYTLKQGVGYYDKTFINTYKTTQEQKEALTELLTNKTFDDITKSFERTKGKDNQEIITALNNSHIFLYPCIWPEASSISLIEAIRCGCLAIHPSLGALPETACNATVMYDFDEDKVEHANIAYNLVRNVLLIENKNPGFINAFGSDTVRELKHNSVSAYKTKWTALLSQLNKVQNG